MNETKFTGKSKLDTYTSTNKQGTFDIIVVKANHKPFTEGLSPERHVSR